ncbi:MAG: hypothetical protein COA74_08640 [Gammaproteobacteria bacterium]|nr:MAG: hypothetical protein COA74_08640 [Gammaproteobacteria bacterium]
MSLDLSPLSKLKANSKIQDRGELLSTVSDKVGCGVYRFEKTGRTQLEALIRNGLSPWHKFLDIGCGAMCGGYWVMHFLDSGKYHGIEPNIEMWQGGVSYILEADLIQSKDAKFDHNDQYDFSVFDTEFDFMFSQSIWTHAGKKDITKMLDGFAKYGSEDARYLTTIKLPDLFHRDYKGDEWVGGSHNSDIAGTVRHSFKWIKMACNERGLTVKRLKGEKINTQHLILIEKSK